MGEKKVVDGKISSERSKGFYSLKVILPNLSPVSCYQPNAFATRSTVSAWIAIPDWDS